MNEETPRSSQAFCDCRITGLTHIYLSLLGVQKEKLPFYLYSYCLMSNHFHLALERKADVGALDADRLLSAVESVLGLDRNKFLGPAKLAASVKAKEALIVAGRELAATMRSLSKIVRLDDSTVGRRCDTARQRSKDDEQLQKTIAKVIKLSAKPV